MRLQNKVYNNLKTPKFMEIEELRNAILAGKVFIYPTDTIYGLGCNAENKEAVNKIKQIKIRDSDKPLSIIAPSIEWIEENLIIDDELKFSLNKYLPGPYTLILKKKNPNFLSWVSNNDSLGVRIPNNDFCRQIQETGIPFITTSVNLSKEAPLLKIKDIKPKIKDKVDFIIPAKDDKELSGKPSTLIINGKEVRRG